MEENTFAFRHWDDVVFENRNKTYGAYLLRQAYAQRLLMGLGVTVAMVVMTLSLQSLSVDRVAAPPDITVYDARVIDLLPPPMVNRKQPPPKRSATTKPKPSLRQIIVTTEEITAPEIEAVEDFIFDNGNESGTFGSVDGIGNIPLDESPAVVLPEIMDIAQVMPTYEGGEEAMMKFIRKKIRYPAAPKRLGIDGTVYVRFVVKGDGTIADVEVIRGVHPDYDKEAVRVISMLPSWKGGSHNGRPVSVRMVLPIKFNLQF